MHDLLEAIQIFAKYTDEKYPSACEHDVLYINVSPKNVSEDDIKKLDELGFFPDEYGGFQSYRFGSC